MSEILERLRHWLTPGKGCRHCCLWCKHYPLCRWDKPNGGVPVLMHFGRRRVATIWLEG